MGSERADLQCGRPAQQISNRTKQVAGPGEPAGAVDHRAAEPGVLPVEEDVDILIPVPIDSDIGSEDLVRPLVGVGQPGGEDLAAQAEPAVSENDFPRASPNRPGRRSNGRSGLTRPRLAIRSPVRKYDACT